MHSIDNLIHSETFLERCSSIFTLSCSSNTWRRTESKRKERNPCSVFDGKVCSSMASTHVANSRTAGSFDTDHVVADGNVFPIITFCSANSLQRHRVHISSGFTTQRGHWHAHRVSGIYLGNDKIISLKTFQTVKIQF